MMNPFTSSHNDFFNHFKGSIQAYTLPPKFNYPFKYDPHPLCRLAAKELQHYLATQTEWVHNFGIDEPVEGTNIGKMFGVLVVRNPQNEIGYLAAFSGKLAGKNNHSLFVPPIVDLLQEDGFYRRGEDEISDINRQIKDIEESQVFTSLKKASESETQQATNELAQFRKEMKAAKQMRDLYRKQQQNQPGAAELEKLKNESLKWQYDYKQLVKQWDGRLLSNSAKLDGYLKKLAHLKELRKTKSADLQQRLFDQYQFLDSLGHYKSVCDIFEQTDRKTPPAGAGDCAAPKLLQHAFKHHMEPLAIAEFWWGQSPKSEIRKHAHFYPSCRSKCEPILGHMLNGMQVDINPVLLPPSPSQRPYIVFEDETIGVLNKPAEYLSVPGKTEAKSVYTFLKQQYPLATGPLIVHRLDMSTSGLMVFAKTLEAYHCLQQQFMDRTVHKRYVALLDGLVADDEGTIDLPIRVDLDDRPRQLVCYDYGKHAVTQWKVIERSTRHTRIHFFPVTGRTHQLRVHSAHKQGLNCPIVGDDLYGQRANRLHLHAEYIQFAHPVTQQNISFQTGADF